MRLLRYSVKIQAVVFWVMTLCSDMAGYHVTEDNAASVFGVK
jgi:hypothetical protein